MSNLSVALDGLVTRLEAGITGLKCYDHPVDSSNTYPCAIVLPQDMDPEIAFAGSTFRLNVDVWLIVASGDSDHGFSLLYDHMDPTETDKSIIAAIKADETLGGTVDYCRVMAIREVGRSDVWGGWYFGARFICEMVKKVA